MCGVLSENVIISSNFCYVYLPLQDNNCLGRDMFLNFPDFCINNRSVDKKISPEKSISSIMPRCCTKKKMSEILSEHFTYSWLFFSLGVEVHFLQLMYFLEQPLVHTQFRFSISYFFKTWTIIVPQRLLFFILISELP